MIVAVDHVQQMLDRLPEHLKELPGWEGFLTDVGAEIQALEDALQQLLLERSIDTAVGAQLAAIGRKVGEPPSGLSDDVYRRRIRARIAANRSRGRVEDLIRITRLVVYDDTATVLVQRQAVAHAIVRLGGAAVADEVADVLIAYLRGAARGAGGAGVRVLLESSVHAPDDTFAFDDPDIGFSEAGAQAVLDISDFAPAVTTVLEAVAPGVAGNEILLSLWEWTGGGDPPGNDGLGLLTDDPAPWFEFYYVSGVTTVADMEAAITAHGAAYIAVRTPGAAHVFGPGAADEAEQMGFAGGVDEIEGGGLGDARE